MFDKDGFVHYNPEKRLIIVRYKEDPVLFMKLNKTTGYWEKKHLKELLAEDEEFIENVRQERQDAK